MSGPKITLYVDVVSPFAYIGFHVLQVHLDRTIIWFSTYLRLF
jgi:predicted DsbA family dithiol-disulfide isomerase